MTKSNYGLPTEVKKNLKIFDFNYWSVFLDENQHYLGSCVVMLKRPEEVLYNLSEEEQREFMDISSKLEFAIVKDFGARKVDFDSSGGFTDRLRFLAKPRYHNEPEFEGVRFAADCYGTHYNTNVRARSLTESKYKKLIKQIRDGLERGLEQIVKDK